MTTYLGERKLWIQTNCRLEKKWGLSSEELQSSYDFAINSSLIAVMQIYEKECTIRTQISLNIAIRMSEVTMKVIYIYK